MTEKQEQVADAYLKFQSVPKAAKALGMSISSVHKHLARYACSRYLKPDRYCPQAPVGFDMKRATLHVDGNGNVLQSWPRVGPVDYTIEQWIESLADRVPACVKIDGPTACNSDLMLEWLLFDHHLGMFSWGKETGADYDTAIAKRLMVSAAEKIFGLSGQVAHAVVVLGGDNQHNDNRLNMTERGGNRLDVDTRYHKTLWSLYDGATMAIDIAAANAQEVTVMVLSGNHDWHSAIALSVILSAHYRQNDRIKINTSPARHKYFCWGSNYFMYSHGDTGGNRLGAYLLNHIVNHGIQGIKRKMVRLGHLHKRGRATPPGLVEDDGVIVERFPTMAAPDAYAADEAYVSQRATAAVLWHQKYGQRGRIEVGVDELMEDR